MKRPRLDARALRRLLGPWSPGVAGPTSDPASDRIDLAEEVSGRAVVDPPATDKVDQLVEMVHHRLTALENALRSQFEALEHATPGATDERQPLAPDDVKNEADLIRSSRLFDEARYLAQHPDAQGDAAAHYVRHGSRAGTDPHPLFHSRWYLRRYPSAAASPTPLSHFLREGGEAGFDPHPLFRSRWYADRYLEGATTPLPVDHFLVEGETRGCNPHPLFDVAWYRERHATLLVDDDNTLVHFLTTGAWLGLDPCRLVDMQDLSRRLPVTGPYDPLTILLEWRATAPGALPSAQPRSVPTAASGELDARWDYVARGIDERDHTFVLYRIIGSDLPPRHRKGQALANVRFILENEPAFEGCEKRWVLNRITDAEKEEQLISLFEEHGHTYLRIPFDEEEYRQIGWRYGDFDRRGISYRRTVEGFSKGLHRAALDHVYHDKNLYLMNNNGARNAALREGRSRGTWVLPWDGNCYLTSEAWNEFREAVLLQPHLKYFAVPMARVLDNSALLQPGFRTDSPEEPQIAFRFDAAEEFDENARYGRRPKAELFYRLGMPGPWDGWVDVPWEPPRSGPGPEAWQFGSAGWVARLFSGEPVSEVDARHRRLRRGEAIRARIDEVDATIARKHFDFERLFVLSEDELDEQRRRAGGGDPEVSKVLDALTEHADHALRQEPESVVDRSLAAPTRDRHDYWSPGPRCRGTDAGDRPGLERTLEDTYILALAWYLTGRRDFSAHAAQRVRTWFLEPATRMNPNLRYARSSSLDARGGTADGVLEMSGLASFLDGVRLLERSGELTTDDVTDLRGWLEEYRSWLEGSRQGRKLCESATHRGTGYELQLASIAAYLDDIHGLLAVYRRTDERRLEHFTGRGKQRHELAGPASLHRCALNLQWWLTLAQAGDRAGIDQWHDSAAGPQLRRAGRWLLPYLEEPWPYRQDRPFDRDRLAVLGYQLEAAYPGFARRAGIDLRPAFTLRTSFPSRTGIRAFWQLGTRGMDISAPLGAPRTRWLA